MALTQLGALLDLEHLGYSVAQAKPLAVLGHSQGVLAVHMTRAIEAAGSIEAAGKTLNEILAVAALIGAAGTRRVRELGLNPKYGEASPMLSVKGATREQVEALVARVNNARGPISIAVTNSDNHHVLSGYPEDLAAFALEAEREHQHQAKLREQKLHGGTVFNPTLEYLEVTLPFHSPLMADAVEQTVAWAGACGFDQKRTRALAEEVLLNHVDWNARVKALFDDADPSKLWIVDLGPGNTLGKLIGNVVQGTGIGVVEATTLAERSTLSMLESEPERTQNWKAFAPRVINTPAGAKLVTKFSKLTGKPPVLLPGMTPTTRGTGNRGRSGQRRLLGRARRRRPGDRRSIRPPHRCPRRRAGGRPHGRIQRDVHGPLPVEPAVRLLPHRAQEAHIRRADRRRGRLRRHP